MIRYPISLEELQARIEREAPGWLADAAERTESFRRAGHYEEPCSSWSRIKKVFMRLQYEKCAYCERLLASEDSGGCVEHDIEHYRPKGRVRRWPTKEIARELGWTDDFPTGEEFAEGYYLLAYNPRNYATACKKCNSPLKGSYFPIGGQRGPQSDDLVSLRSEEPLLLYPLGDVDDDPEEVLTFKGVNPAATVETGPLWRRAKVTIQFFRLHVREDLLRERASIIEKIFIALEALLGSEGPDRHFLSEVIQNQLSPASPHTNCARAFVQIYNENRALARDFAFEAREYLKKNRLKMPRHDTPRP